MLLFCTKFLFIMRSDLSSTLGINYPKTKIKNKMRYWILNIYCQYSWHTCSCHVSNTNNAKRPMHNKVVQVMMYFQSQLYKL